MSQPQTLAASLGWLAVDMYVLSPVSMLRMLLFVHYHLLTGEQPKEKHDASFWKEIRAGITTFTAMLYIVAVNVSCSCHNWSKWLFAIKDVRSS